MKLYTGSAWVAAYVSGAGFLALSGGTMTGTTNFVAGSAAAPGIAASGDTNTGIFFPAADTIAFAEGGAEAMRIDSSGNVGVGVTAPASKLSVGGNPPASGAIAGVGTSGGTSLALSDNVNSSLYVRHPAGLPATIGTDSGGQLAFATNGSIERFRIGSSGQFGIGGANYGTSGQVLTSAGSGAAPSWATPTVSFASTTAWASVSRTSGTTYTNSLSYPIMFLVTGGLNGTLTVVVNGVTVMSLTAAYSNYEFCCVIVPPGATYSYTTAVTSATGTFILS